jgi:hypothetical protein
VRRKRKYSSEALLLRPGDFLNDFCFRLDYCPKKAGMEDAKILHTVDFQGLAGFPKMCSIFAPVQILLRMIRWIMVENRFRPGKEDRLDAA